MLEVAGPRSVTAAAGPGLDLDVLPPTEAIVGLGITAIKKEQKIKTVVAYTDTTIIPLRFSPKGHKGN